MVGVTRPVTLTVNRMHCGEDPFSKKHRCGFDAVVTIKRSDFGIKYGIPLISDQMDLSFAVEAVKN